MLAMAAIPCIKHGRDKGVKIIQSIAENLQINARTANEYADSGDFNVAGAVGRQWSRQVIGPHQNLIDSWF